MALRTIWLEGNSSFKQADRVINLAEKHSDIAKVH